jgi:dUTP pyrophosphatase
MFNHADVEFAVKAGDRIAQLVCERISYPELQELDSLDTTQRGEGGFGSTGTN